MKIVKYLVEHGAVVSHNTISDGTPLHGAVKSGSFEIVKYLVEHGANVNCAINRRDTPLDFVAEMKSLEMIEYFCENNATVTRENDYTWSKILY